MNIQTPKQAIAFQPVPVSGSIAPKHLRFSAEISKTAPEKPQKLVRSLMESIGRFTQPEISPPQGANAQQLKTELDQRFFLPKLGVQMTPYLVVMGVIRRWGEELPGWISWPLWITASMAALLLGQRLWHKIQKSTENTIDRAIEIGRGNVTSQVAEANDATFEQMVLKAKGPVLVDFWAPWCAPCKALEPTLEGLAAQQTGKATVVKVNIDESPKTKEAYNIRGIPQVVVFRDGQEIDRAIGKKPLAVYEALLEKQLEETVPESA